MRHQALNTLLEPVAEGLGYQLVGVEYLPQGRHSLIRIYIDHENGISVEDCEKVSRQVSAVMDVEDPISGQYTLEVSSPGLDRPLFTAPQFEQFLGNVSSVRMKSPIDGRRKFQGTIKGVDGNIVTLAMDDKDVQLPVDDMEKANLVPGDVFAGR